MRFLLFIIAFTSVSFGSPKTNLEIIFEQLDTLAVKAENKIFNKKIRPQTEFPQLQNKLETSIARLDSNIILTQADNYGTSIILDSISVQYDEQTNTRQITTSLYIQTLADDNIVEYRVSSIYQDTIDLEMTSELEDESYAFTIGIMNTESSFWDDVWEPSVYVVGAAAILYLLFSVRSG